MAEGGSDDLLDDPDLPELLRAMPGYAAPSAKLFVYVVVRHTLRDVGVHHPDLADYVATLVLAFGMGTRASRVTAHDDREYRYLVDLVAESETVPERRRFLLRVHLGNYSLWQAGIFPDFVTARRHRRGGPGLDYYDTMGARGFRLASDDPQATALELADLYGMAADSFPAIRVALNRLSDETLFCSVHSPDRLMRQVSDVFRFPPAGPLC